jgi:hypothetical protein
VKSKDKYSETLLWWAVKGWHKIREIYSLNTRLVGFIDFINKIYKLVVQLLLKKDDNIDFNIIYT